MLMHWTFKILALVFSAITGILTLYKAIKYAANLFSSVFLN